MAISSASKSSANFVFKGSVRRTKAANLKAVVDRKRTSVVCVDEIVRAPEALMDQLGQDITVKLAKGERVREGQRAEFYTNGWIFGENLAVQSLGHEPVRAAAAIAADAIEEADPVAVAAHHQIRQCASEATVIISGKVIAVGEVQPEAVASSAATEFQPVSEHTPFWTEAVVEVQKAHRGQTQGKRIVVRFPSSTDIRWYEAPKFQVGQAGVFMLEPDKVSQLPKVGAAAAALDSEESYTCLNPVGFQAADRDAEIASALDAIGAGNP